MQDASQQRAMILIEQHRWPDAERELRGALATDPQNAAMHSLLSLVMLEQLKLKEATELAERAIVLDPEESLAHYALAAALQKRNRFAEALRPLEEAIRLDPYDPKQWALLAQIKIDQRNWQAALDAANRGLEIDPAHDACVNLRGIALVQLGDRGAASSTIEGALERDPENATTHANQGWALLHQNQPKRAMEHFREALRLDPNMDWAKAGIVEAMKARNPLYRLLLMYFLFMSRQSDKAQWGIIIGGYIGYRIVLSIRKNNPDLAPYLLPVIIAYVVFALSTWLAPHLLNLLLRFDRFGRYVLSDEQRIGANIVGSILLVAAGIAVVGITVDEKWLWPAAMVAFISLPASLIMIADAGWPRMLLIGMSLALATCVTLVVLMDMNVVTDTIGGGVQALFSLCLLVSVFGGQAIAAVRVQR